MTAVLVLASALLNASSLAPGARSCTSLPSPHLRVRLTVGSGPAESMAPGIRHIVNSVWQPEGLTFDWVEGFVEKPWDGIDVWIAAVDGAQTARGSRLGEVQFGGAP